mgnify:CR=1 FL=1
MNFLELAKERYSCRQLSDKKVEKEKLDKIIEAGILAPTATNAQPYKIWLIESDEAKENLLKRTGISLELKFSLWLVLRRMQPGYASLTITILRL